MMSVDICDYQREKEEEEDNESEISRLAIQVCNR